MIKPYILLLLIISTVHTQVQAELPGTVFLYEEMEPGTERFPVRYLVSTNFLRVDNGQKSDDFILFDRDKNTVYSINHTDQTILVIEPHPWTLISFDFNREEQQRVLEQAPRLFDQVVHNYQLLANGETCAEFQLVPNVFETELQLFKAYQLVLSGQQVKSVDNTPAEMQTPCFLIDQIYNTGRQYELGLPVQEWHSRGYVRILKDFKRHDLDDDLFVLPGAYTRYQPL